ncbi:hypothetical protein [Modestobacter sp. SSW1-42]|uniref:hypothetical protein n=1 Tax=Modestobacter sp. SSW1-42 TaxID=596372 RepID=UPI003986C473
MLIGWFGLSLVLAPVVGRAIREAERREGPAALLPVPAPRAPRRRIPMPPVAAVLLLVSAGLEAVGFVIRATGNERGAARLWAMDLPLSVPRMFVAALFAAAAVVAVIGAARGTGRRPWWLAVAGVTAAIAQVKAGGTVHVRALEVTGVAHRPVLAAVGSAAVVAVVVAGLWWLSRTERRDRRRVLTALSLYSSAAVGLSAVSSLAARAGDPFWSAAATFVEETGEAFGGVAVLVAVLVGVAPRLVLPADWVLRRTADAETVDAPGALPSWQTARDHRLY